MYARDSLGFWLLHIARGKASVTDDELAVLKRAYCGLCNRGFDGPLAVDLRTTQDALAAANESLAMLKYHRDFQPEWVRNRLAVTEFDESPYVELLKFHGVPQRDEVPTVQR